MNLVDVTFVGPAIDDPEILSALPPELLRVLEDVNGFVAFRGGLHVRGACLTPTWHSLRAAWRGEESLSLRYAAVLESDIPFGQDAVGDQFLLRDGRVYRLAGETGELEALGVSFPEFLAAATADPEDYLLLAPLLEFERRGGRLQPGELLSVYPPFCTEQSKQGVSLRAVPVEERSSFLADFAARIAALPDGA